MNAHCLPVGVLLQIYQEFSERKNDCTGQSVLMMGLIYSEVQVGCGHREDKLRAFSVGCEQNSRSRVESSSAGGKA